MREKFERRRETEKHLESFTSFMENLENNTAFAVYLGYKRLIHIPPRKTSYMMSHHEESLV